MDAETLRNLVLKCVAAEYPGELWRSRLDRELAGRATPDEVLRALNYLHDSGLLDWRLDADAYVYRLTPTGWIGTIGREPGVTDLAGAIVDVLCLEYPHHVQEHVLLGALLEKRGMSGVDKNTYENAIGYLVQRGYVARREAAITAGDRLIDRRREYKLMPAGIDLAEGSAHDTGVTF